MDNQNAIGWIGTGVMGAAMVSRLIDEGHTCYIFSRTKSKAAHLIDKGAIWCESPAQVAQECKIIFTIIGMPHDVEDVYLGTDGLINHGQSGSIFIDMTTSEPSLANKIAEQASAKEINTLDAPVSGGDIGAKNGALSIMVGGDKKSFDTILPLFEIMGKNIVYQGNAGSGQHTKMCNQITIAGTMIGVCESLLYAYKAGLDAKTMLSSISGGAAQCWTLNNLAPRIIDGDFDPGFYIEHFIKDMGIAVNESEKMGIALPGLSLVKQLYIAAKAQGHGRNGTQALFLALKKLSENN